MSSPDVALICPYPSAGRHGGPSGVASYGANLSAALAEAGASVHVVAPRERGAPATAIDGAVRVERSFARGPAALPRAAARALSTGARVVHLQHEFFLYGGPAAVPGLPLALGAMRAAGAGPVVTMHHGVDPASVDAEFMRLHRVRAPARLGRLALGSVQRVIRALSRRVIVHEPLFARWIPGAAVVPHGLERARDAHLPAAQARAALGLEQRFTVLCLGFIAPYKGLELGLEAVAGAGDELQLVVAGGEHPRLAAADPYARRLRERWSQTARFTGHVPEADLPTVFAAADVALFTYPTAFSSSGTLALALAHQTPVLLSPALAGASGAPAELEVPLEPAPIGDRLLGLARDRGALAAVARASASLTRGRSWGRIAARHLRIYEEAIDASRATRRRLRAT